MRTVRFFYLLLMMMLFAGVMQAQTVKTSTNKKAIKQYEKGYAFMRDQQFTDAIRYAKTAAQEDPGFTEAYLMIAEAYSMMKESDLAVLYYKKAIYSNPSFSSKLYYYTAREYMRSNNYNEALEYFVQYFEEAGIDKSKASPEIKEHYDQCVYRAKLQPYQAGEHGTECQFQIGRVPAFIHGG